MQMFNLQCKVKGDDVIYTGPPPIYHPQVVVDSILYAATNPVDHLPVGDAAWLTMLVCPIFLFVLTCSSFLVSSLCTPSFPNILQAYSIGWFLKQPMPL